MDWIKEKSTNELVCRTVRHAWQYGQLARITEPVEGLGRFYQVVQRTLECMRCSANRIEYLGRENPTSQFRRVKGRYIYPKGYLFGATEGNAPSTWDYFEELLSRS